MDGLETAKLRDPRAYAEAAFAALNAHDIDRFLEFIHPDADFLPLLAGVDGGPYLGIEGVRRWMLDLWDAWESLRAELKAVDAISERVIMIEYILRLRAHGSEVEIETVGFGVFERDETLRKSKSWRFFATAAEARAAAALVAARG